MKHLSNLRFPSRRNFGGCAQCLFTDTQGFDTQLEYGFEMNTSNIKFGSGIIQELGVEAIREKRMKRIAVFTDKGLIGKYPLEYALDSLRSFQKTVSNVSITVFDSVSVEPTDVSCKEAIRFAIDGKFDGYISVGGGSVMDTCKIANLYATHPTDDFLRYVNAPIGKAMIPPGPLMPHIAIPTTCGTGSEATGFAIFDLLSLKSKTGIGHKHLIPTMALVDPLVTDSLTPMTIACSGFDTLSHAIESFTAIPYSSKIKTKGKLERPLHQGSNLMSDFGCLKALELTTEYFLRAVKDPKDRKAREMMLFASTLAGTAMGNAGVHLCHGLSYPVSALAHDRPNSYVPHANTGYPRHQPMIPHGMSVILHAPSVFNFLSHSTSEKLVKVAKTMNLDLRGVDPKDAGKLVSTEIIRYMKEANMPSGLETVGFSQSDISDLAPRAFMQKRVINNAPISVSESDIKSMYQGALKYW